MTYAVLRKAMPHDAATIARMARLMVADMAEHGGHRAAPDDDAWRTVAEEIAGDLFEDHVRYVLAETDAGEAIGVAGAKVITLGGAFAAARLAHVTTVYVMPDHRRGGLGTRLFEDLLAWGREAGCDRCSLNVLAGNPARTLYERLGFSVFEMAMVRPLA